MKTYKVISTQNQGIYTKGELIRVIKTNNISEMFGLENDKSFNLAKITSDSCYQVRIEEI